MDKTHDDSMVQPLLSLVEQEELDQELAHDAVFSPPLKHPPSTSTPPSTPPFARRSWRRSRASTTLSRVRDYLDDRTRAGMLLSRRAWIIYALFFIPPFIITLLWLLIPLYNYPAYCFSISLYYAFAFMAWISFYNILIPGCHTAFKLLGFVAFIVPLVFYLISARHSDRRKDKLAYTVIHIITFATTTLCYFVYVVFHKARKYFQESYRAREAVRDQVKAQQPSKLAYRLCFYPSIDDDSLHTWVSYKPGTTLTAKVVTWKNLFLVSLYQLVVVVVWIWLQEFTAFKVNGSLGAIASIVIFQTSKIILIGICGFVNSLLPPTPYDSVTHFTLFQLQISFLLYYRTLFMSFSGWIQTVLVAVVTLLFDILYYPLRMKFSVYNFRYVTLKLKAEARGYDTKFAVLYNALFKENVTYEEVTNVMCIEYYYEKISEYYSIISTVIFISILRGLEYHKNTYTSFTLLTSQQYRLLLLRYLFLFLFETSTDVLLRLFTKYKMGIDISNKGRNFTISNYVTRFLFATFMIYDLITVYYSQINVQFT